VLLRAVREAIGEVDALPTHDEDAAMFGYPRSGASKPQAHLVSKVDLAGILPDLEPALEQTWDWGAAREAVTKARAALAFNDMPTGDLRERLALFQRVVRVLIVQFPVLALLATDGGPGSSRHSDSSRDTSRPTQSPAGSTLGAQARRGRVCIAQ
jgi:hypothetical protein